MQNITPAEYASAIASENADAIRRMQAAQAKEPDRIAALERRVAELESLVNTLAEKVFNV